MSTSAVAYFHSLSLKHRYLDELGYASRSKRLAAHESSWLQTLIYPPEPGDPDPVRVDRITLEEGAIRPFELAGALLLSHSLTDDATVYLYSLTHGFEVFEDRHGLLAQLQIRFADGDANGVFEDERIDGDPFQAQMFEIVDQQVEQVAQLTAQLKLTPTLADVATASITAELRTALPYMPVDPQSHLLQIVPQSDVDASSILLTQTLAQAAFDDACKLPKATGFRRRFLDAQGAQVKAGDAASFTQAFDYAVAGLPELYTELLGAFWEGEWSNRRTRHELAVETFSSSVRRELYGLRSDNSVGMSRLKTLLSPLQPASRHVPDDSPARCATLQVKVGDSVSCPLAGTFVIQPGMGDDRSLLWFSPSHRFANFRDLASLNAYLATAQGREQLRPALAIEDQPLLRKDGPLQIDLQYVTTPLCIDRVDSILALQARNLRYVLGLSCAPEDRMALVDDGLDIRQLLDPRQLQFSSRRWRPEASFDFADAWLAIPGATQPGMSADGSEVASPVTSDVVTGKTRKMPGSWKEWVNVLESRAQRLRGLDNVLLDQTEQVLQRYLCVLVNGAVSARNIKAQWLGPVPVEPTDAVVDSTHASASRPEFSRDLVSLLLEAVSGHGPGILPDDAHVLIGDERPRGRIKTVLINHMLAKAVKNFDEGYFESFRQSRSELQRQGKEYLRSNEESISLREDALRLDLWLAQRLKQIDTNVNAMVRQVLDRPVRSLRTALPGLDVEAYSVVVSYDDVSPITLTDALVVMRPFNAQSRVMLWCGGFGWRSFATLEHLQTFLKCQFHTAQQEQWLALMSENDRRMLRKHLFKESDNQVMILLDRIDGHLVTALQQSVVDRQQQDLRQLTLRAERYRMDAALLKGVAHTTELDTQLDTLLDALWVRIDTALFEARLPSWVSSATIADLNLYNDIWRRYYLASEEGKDYLFGIVSLEEYSRPRLLKRLRQDFPGHQLDPDKIIVTSKSYVPSLVPTGNGPGSIPAATEKHSESLTAFAINRFIQYQTAVVTVEPQGQPHAAALLTEDYLRELVRSLDVGAGYMTLLRKALSPDDPSYALRNRLFVEQLPPLLLAVALPQRIKDKNRDSYIRDEEGPLSARAFEFISQVVDMPDGAARELLGGTQVIISPLQLVADVGMAPDRVTGVHLICPSDPAAGPVVLYAMYHPEFTFREYENEQALMAGIRSDESLQRMLLQRIEPEARRRYANGGFDEPHVPFYTQGSALPLRKPGPVTVALAEVTGNALQFLFNDTLKLLLDMGVDNTVTNDQVDWAGRAFLATLGLQQVLTLLPGKLAKLMTLWQSESLFSASVASVSHHRWGEGLSEFSAALGVLVSAREQTIEEPVSSEPEGAGSVDFGNEDEEPSSTFSWRNTSLNAEQRLRLQRLEAKGVAIAEMHHDGLFNQYVDKAGLRYAVVDGKVYRVSKDQKNGVWSIVGADGAAGPKLVADGRQRWRMDLSLGLKGGGGAVVSKYHAVRAEYSADDVMIIEASGMRDIRKKYFDKARRIGEAHLQAKRYLENCLDNLNVHQPGRPLDPRVTGIIGNFFGATPPGRDLLVKTEQTMRTLLDAIMDPSLAPFTSPRFVVGINKAAYNDVTAFVIKADPKKRVFLTELFFNTPRYDLTPKAISTGFVSSRHYRAANLIHELSHLALDTHDIAYLESMAPYPDLLRADTPSNASVQSHIQLLHHKRLSSHGPRHELFTITDKGVRRDMVPGDQRGLETIFRITRTNDLRDARDEFMSDVTKRSEVMLSNADSVALLAVRLGRYNYSVP
jgi:hypothetical protein